MNFTQAELRVLLSTHLALDENESAERNTCHGHNIQVAEPGVTKQASSS